jgi:glycosyltransferase involved in cell wall biosynthesis
MRIGIAGPLGTPDVEHLLDGDTSHLPREMVGASLLVTLIERLLAMGHEVVAYTTDPQLRPRPPETMQAQGKGLTVHYLPRRRHALRPDRGALGRMTDLFALERRTLAHAMREDPPDIIHAHWSYEFGGAAIDSGLPYLLTCHDSPTAILKNMRDLYRLGRWVMAREILRKAKDVTVVSPYLVNELAGFLRSTPVVIPNPIPDRLFANGRVRTTRDYTCQPPRLAMLLNGWTNLKNPIPGMQAMLRVKAAYPGAELHLFGPGFGVNESAAKWATTKGCEEAFVFHGWVPYGEATQALSEMDMLLHPALEESFGMTLGEAMALGVPVVAGEHSGAVPWVTNQGEAGALVDVCSAEAMAEAVMALLSDPVRYREASSKGLARANSMFSAKAVANQYVELYCGVLGGRV